MTKMLDELEDQSFYAENLTESPPKDIVAYNELRSCADIFRMYKQGVLIINPEFQRDQIWKPSSQTRFIDSLVKQLPIPSMCFSYDAEKQEWLVIDGLQRISTIVKFLKGEDWTLSKLDDIDPKLSNVSAAKIKNDSGVLHKLYTAVENLSIPITVLRCNHSKYDHLKYLFTIFHRLNSEGMKLNNQEIRNCIFSGTFNRTLKELSQKPEWKKLTQRCKISPVRFRDQELILRIMAFSEDHKKYNGRLTSYLNEFMNKNRYKSEKEKSDILDKYSEIAKILISNVFDKDNKKYSITIFESLLVGVASNIATINKDMLKENFRLMLQNDLYSDKNLREGLSSKNKVTDRLDYIKELFK